MKKVLFGLLALGSSALFGQDYYSPTNKDAEPLARFPIDITVQDGLMNYTLPKELVGVENKISLVEVSRVDGIRTFSGPKATAVCMGADKTPGCVVTHRNLDKNKDLAESAIKQKFADPNLRLQALNISKEFSDFEHSGNEPIGFIGALKPRKVPWVEPISASDKISKWNVEWQPNSAAPIAAYLYFDEKSKASTQSKTDPEKPIGTLENIYWSDFHASGTWKAGTSTGWFDITFNAAINQFDGFYGDTTSQGNVRKGRFHGDLIKAGVLK